MSIFDRHAGARMHKVFAGNIDMDEKQGGFLWI